MVSVSICVGVNRQCQEAQGIDSILFHYHDKFAFFVSHIKTVECNTRKWFL